MGNNSFSILGDSPVNDTADRLDFGRFVTPFAERLVASIDHTPFTVGIFADWGQGKTTVMQMLRNALKRSGCPTIWFDPWKYNSREDVWKGLALTLAEEVREQDTLWREYRRKRNTLKQLFAEALTSAVVGKKWAEKIIAAIKTEPWSPGLLHEFESNLSTMFELIDPANERSERKPLVLFVDDLDRCLPEPALAVLEALKLVLNKPGMITVMGIAETELSRSVLAAYAKELEALKTDIDSGWGQKYIQKIIQMPFPLPVISPISFSRYVEDCLDKSGVGAAFERKDNWVEIIRETCRGNLREVKRFINHFISEMDKASANSSPTSKSVSDLSAPRVAFVLLLGWRFRPFLDHIRLRANDPELLIRYQLFFSKRAKSGVSEISDLHDGNETFHLDESLANFFARCFERVPEGDAPLVVPFSGWPDLEPYLQFGIPSRRVAPANQEGAEHRMGPDVRERSDRRTERSVAPRRETGQEGNRTESEMAQDVPESVGREQRLRMSEAAASILEKARSLMASGHAEAAQPLLTEGIGSVRSTSDLYGEELLLGQLGQALVAMERHQEARKACEEALAIARKLDDKQGEITGLITLAGIHRAENNLSEAFRLLRNALTVAHSASDRFAELSVLLEEGATHEAAAARPPAVASYERALALAKELGHRAAQLLVLLKIAGLEEKTSTQKALESALEAKKLAEELGDKAGLLRASEVKLRLELAMGGTRLPDLNDAWAPTLRMAEELRDHAALGRMHSALGEAFETGGYTLDAEAHFSLAVKALRDAGDTEAADDLIRRNDLRQKGLAK